MRIPLFMFISVSLPLLVTASLAQSNKKDGEATKLTSSIKLVLIPTIVTDKSGGHVSGLKIESFGVQEDGKSRRVAVFEEVKTDKTRLRRTAGESGKFSNLEAGQSGYHRLSIIVLDFVNTRFSDQSSARAALIKFLTQVAESGEPMCLLALDRGGVTVIHEFTDDPKNLAEALRRLSANHAPLVHEMQSEASAPPATDALSNVLNKLIREMRQTEKQLESVERKDTAMLALDGLNQIAKAFGGLPGRKSLIWASAGFPYSLSPPSKLLCEPACPVQQRTEIQPLYDRLWRTMNDAQIAIYSIDLRSLATSNLQAGSGSDTFTHPYDVGDPEFDKAAEERWETQDTSATLRLFAENTGGKAFTNSNDLIQGFRQAVEDDSNYYMLGYYVERSKTKPGWHKLTVTVREKGVHARFRNGFFLTEGHPTGYPREDMRLALISPLDFAGIPVTVSWSGNGPGREPGKNKVQFDLTMPAGFALVDEGDQNHMLLDVAAVARNAKGEAAGEASQHIDRHLNAEGLEQIRQNGMTYRGALHLAPGEYTVRFVVRDSLADRMGSVAAPIKVSPLIGN
jgi:VWFA-related protein